MGSFMVKKQADIKNLKLKRIKVLCKENQAVIRLSDKTEYYSISKKNKVKIIKKRYKVR